MDSVASISGNQTQWFRTHWKLLTLVAGGLVTLAAAFVVFIFLIVFGLMRHSGAYVLAISEARETPAVVNQVGEDLRGGWFMTGNINTSGPSGHAELAIPLSGAKGKGTLYTVADQESGEWKMCSLIFMPDLAGTKVVIVDNATTHCTNRSSQD